jgi:uncharacterized membrane protein
MRLREWAERIRHSLWFIPTLAVLLAAIAALGMVALSDAIGPISSDLPIVFAAGADGARAMLQAIAGSVITVAGVVFSITIVALQLTSTQFSPRVLRNFLSDRPNQVVLGTFIGTFTYTLLVLRSIRGESAGAEEFVPGPAITGALLLTFVSLAMLIYFFHHISVRLQVTSIVASVADDTIASVERVAAWAVARDDRGWRPAAPQSPAAQPPPTGAVPPRAMPPAETPIDANANGYLQLIDLAAMVTAARDADARIRLLVAPGAWVQAHTPVGSVTSAADNVERLASAMRRALTLGNERSAEQDVAFGIQQLVDIAIKALSPSVNDPTTATHCIDRLLSVLVAAGRSDDPPRALTDASGTTRVEISFLGFAELVPLAFDQVRQYGGSKPEIVVHLAHALTVLRRALSPARRGPVLEQARLLAEASMSIEPESARRRALGAVEPLLR